MELRHRRGVLVSLAALRQLAGGPKPAACEAVARFLAWCATYEPPTRFGQLEIDGVYSPPVVRAPETARAEPGVRLVQCPQCGCKGEAVSPSTNRCHHCVFEQPCPRAGQEEQAVSWVSLIEIDNPVDHDAVADGIVMFFYYLRNQWCRAWDSGIDRN